MPRFLPLFLVGQSVEYGTLFASFDKLAGYAEENVTSGFGRDLVWSERRSKSLQAKLKNNCVYGTRLCVFWVSSNNLDASIFVTCQNCTSLSEWMSGRIFKNHRVLPSLPDWVYDNYTFWFKKCVRKILEPDKIKTGITTRLRVLSDCSNFSALECVNIRKRLNWTYFLKLFRLKKQVLCVYQTSQRHRP